MAMSERALMDDEPGYDLLMRAAAAYKGVVADPRSFGPVATRLVAEARRVGDAEALVMALRAEAWSERARLANTRAKELLDEAVRVARRHRLDDRLGDVLVTRAAVNLESGRSVAAQHDLDRAAAVLRDGRSPELDLQRAVLLQNLGRLSDAAAVYRRVLADPICSVDVRAKVANNLALIEVQRGNHEAAFEYLDEAAALAAKIGPALVAPFHQSRAWVTVQAGRLTASLRLFDEALRLYEAASLPLGEHYLEHADALVDLRLLPEASTMAQRAVEQFQVHGVLLMAAEAQLRAAWLALLNGDHPQAVADATAAIRSFRRQRRTAWAARATVIAVEAGVQTGEVSLAQLRAARRAATTLEKLSILSNAVEAHLAVGRVAAALGKRSVALAALQRAHQLARDAPVLVRLKGHVSAALAARLRRHDRAVVQHCRTGLADLRRHQAALASMELRALASGHGVELGRLGLEVLVRTGSAPRVLDWMERTRAAALFVVEPPDVEGFEEELTALQAVHAELAQARRDSAGEPPELLAKQTAIESGLRRAGWARQASGTVRRTVVSPAELRRLFDGHVLVAYGTLNGQLLAVVLEARRTRLVQLGSLEPVQFEANALLFALRRLTRPSPSPASLAGARASADLSLRRLAELLLRPLGLPDDAPLVVIPSGRLQHLPWSALHTAPVSAAPSASFWARTRQRQAGPGGDVVLVAGPELPGAVAEVDALRGLHRRPAVLVPPASTVGAAADALNGAALAHLACHGQLRSDNPTFSSLLLSNGSLTVQELDLRGIAPHRIILAACDSATGVSYEGDELLGFVSALIARGTAGLIASTVTVPDLEAVSLMRSLHECLLRGDTLADALHAARATVDRTDPRAFVNWCAFTAFGAA
jgi:tetratricopeptide (TPR) repeat protein